MCSTLLHIRVDSGGALMPAVSAHIHTFAESAHVLLQLDVIHSLISSASFFDFFALGLNLPTGDAY